ncbi:hypothetical protein, partial [Komagataeibacter oboediens]|uniref:hypothetical protein n=1 Tax=Komagataeibacter oboediens TaxID=65958 RepID=UPI001E3D889A
MSFWLQLRHPAPLQPILPCLLDVGTDAPAFLDFQTAPISLHERLGIPGFVRHDTVPVIAFSHPDQQFFVGWQVAADREIGVDYAGSVVIIRRETRAYSGGDG